MKICAITMVYRDHWALTQWFLHYSRHLGAANLFVVAHGADDKLPRICPGANILTVPRDRMDGFDAMRETLLNGLQAGLGAIYDWVIRTDADELICLDPARYGSFDDLLRAQQGDAVFALGMNIAELPDDPAIPRGERALPLRRAAAFSGHYSKAWAARNGQPILRHGIAVPPRKVASHPFVLPSGVYLMHLKYAWRPALRAANQHRQEIANGEGKGLPGSAWQKPMLATRKFFARFEALPEAPWDEAQAAAHAKVATDPTRDGKKGMIRAANPAFDSRTTLPERIAAF